MVPAAAVVLYDGTAVLLRDAATTTFPQKQVSAVQNRPESPKGLVCQ